ncbi:MAG: RNA methyltransferase [Cyanobium sp.]
MSLPEQLLLSDLLRRRVRCERGQENGTGVAGWMHPPVHRLLGWVSRPSAFSQRRLVWRLDQLRGIDEQELLVVGEPAETDPVTLGRLPTLLEASLSGVGGRPLGTISDAAVELRSGRIRHYLVSRSDPRLPGGSRWRLSPDRIVDQQPGRVMTALEGLDDLPLARASVRQELLRRSRRWRDQVEGETARLRDQLQQAGGRLEDRLEGWLEEQPWDGPDGPRDPLSPPPGPDPLDDWEEDGWDAPASAAPPPRPRRGQSRDDDPWI